jgi:hypothetical protein
MPDRSLQRRILLKPFVHEWVRSTTHRPSIWSGAGTPIRAMTAVIPQPSSSRRVGAPS